MVLPVDAGLGHRDGAGQRRLPARDAPACAARAWTWPPASPRCLRSSGRDVRDSSLDARSRSRPVCRSRACVTGLWQIADMERDGRALDLEAAARAMTPYVDAGFTSFDMADHYGSAEIIAGQCRALGDPDRVQLFTKWVPKPGPVTAADVRAAVERSLDAPAHRDHRPAAVPRLELRRPVVARRALPSAGAEARGADPAPRPHQRGRRAPARGAGQRHRGGVEPGELLAARSPRRRAARRACAPSTAWACSPTARCAAAG